MNTNTNANTNTKKWLPILAFGDKIEEKEKLPWPQTNGSLPKSPSLEIFQTKMQFDIF